MGPPPDIHLNSRSPQLKPCLWQPLDQALTKRVAPWLYQSGHGTRLRLRAALPRTRARTAHAPAHCCARHCTHCTAPHAACLPAAPRTLPHCHWHRATARTAAALPCPPHRTRLPRTATHHLHTPRCLPAAAAPYRTFCLPFGCHLKQQNKPTGPDPSLISVLTCINVIPAAHLGEILLDFRGGGLTGSKWQQVSSCLGISHHSHLCLLWGIPHSCSLSVTQNRCNRYFTDTDLTMGPGSQILHPQVSNHRPTWDR